MGQGEWRAIGSFQYVGSLKPGSIHKKWRNCRNAKRTSVVTVVPFPITGPSLSFITIATVTHWIRSGFWVHLLHILVSSQRLFIASATVFWSHYCISLSVPSSHTASCSVINLRMLFFDVSCCSPAISNSSST